MKELNLMKKAVKKAAKKIFLKGSKRINYKGQFDYFTDNDLACEKFFISYIKKYFPDDSIIGEETCKDEKFQKRTWIIDPIDGTHNYANGLKTCGIQVAFCENEEVKFAIIYLPYFKELYTCVKGNGVLLNGKKLETAKNMSLNQSLIEFSTLQHDERIKKITVEAMSKINEKVLDMRVVGCGSWEFASMLQRKFGAYVLIRKKICKWDLIPGVLMCKENGLKVLNEVYDGVEFLVVANNDEIFQYVVKIVKESILNCK